MEIDPMAFLSTALFAVGFLLLLLAGRTHLFPSNVSSSKRQHPPSPWRLPILGHLHFLGKPVHRSLAALSQTYGPVLLLRLGSRRVLLVSSPSAAEECLTTHDVTFANRPLTVTGKVLGYNYTDIMCSSYGPHWRNLRRIAASEILSSHRIHSTSSVRSGEVRALVRHLFREASAGVGLGADGFTRLELKSRLFGLAFNVVMRTVAGKRYYGEGVEDEEEAERFRSMVEDIAAVAGVANIEDYLPWLGWADVRFNRKLSSVKKKVDTFLGGLIEDHRRRKEDGERRGAETEGGGERTVIDVLLSLQDSDSQYYSDELIKALLLDMLSASTDTTAATMEWAMSLLLNNPETMKQARDEIDTQVKKDQLVDEVDLLNLPYLRAVINETLRLYPVAPLLLPHESSDDCLINGYHVPKGTMLLINAWAIQRDEKVWEGAMKFKPERFLLTKEVSEGHKLIPFGSGRRKCPGEALATRVVGLAIGALLQCFEWKRVGEIEVDMEEGIALTMSRANPLVIMYKPRHIMMNVLDQI